MSLKTATAYILLSSDLTFLYFSGYNKTTAIVSDGSLNKWCNSTPSKSIYNPLTE